MMDEELVVPKGSDDTLFGKFVQTHSSHEKFRRYVKVKNAFTVCHYAGDVV